LSLQHKKQFLKISSLPLVLLYAHWQSVK